MDMAKVREGYKETEIGVIPVEWEVKRLIELSDRSDRYSFTGGPFGSDLKSSDYTEDGVRVIQLQNIGDGKFYNISKVYTSYEKANQLSSCNIFPNEIILAKMAEPVARACKMPSFNDRYLMCSDGIRLKVDSNFYNTDYCLHSINSSYFRKKAIENSTGTTRLRIGLTALKELKLAIPTLQEQQRIAEILSTTDEHIEKLDKTIEDYQLLKKGMMKKLLTEGIGHTEFKETEIGRIPKEWGIETVEYTFLKQTKNQYKQLKTKEYLDVGNYPIVDQGQQYICGYTNDEEKLYKGDIPVIVFGDHTRIIKYINFKFAVGADGTQILKADKNKFNDKFYYYVLLNTSIINQGYHRHFKFLKESKIVKPSMNEQIKIASILSEFDSRIDQYQQQRQDFIQLKKALMEQLLTGKIRVNQ